MNYIAFLNMRHQYRKCTKKDENQNKYGLSLAFLSEKRDYFTKATVGYVIFYLFSRSCISYVFWQTRLSSKTFFQDQVIF